MGWSVYIQIVRDRPLTISERKQLATHARTFELSERSEPYVFRVAPAGARGGVIAEAMGKFGKEPDPDEDEDTARVLAALTELRGLFRGASLEVADDLVMVGWDGEAYDLVDDPDQEMTAAPRDRSAWLTVPPPKKARARPARDAAAKKPAKRAKPPSPLELAIAAVAAGRRIEDSEALSGGVMRELELHELTRAAFAALQKAAKAEDHERRRQLDATIDALPAEVVVAVGLAQEWLMTEASTGIGTALGRLTNLDAVRDPLLALWFRGAGKSSDFLWNKMGGSVMEAAMRDPRVVAELGTSLINADLGYREGRRHTETMSLLANTAGGLPYVIRRRRNDRRAATPPPLQAPLLNTIEMHACRETLPTLLLELAQPGADRDPLLLAIARVDDPRVSPILERALATDQYTRAVAKALLHVPGARAEALLEGLSHHVDPLVRIIAAQVLVARRGAAAIPQLLAAAGHARAAGIWNDDRLTSWPRDFDRVDAVRQRLWELRGCAWPEELKTAVIPEVTVAPDELVSARVRMLSVNPDVRRDAIESAHREMRAARDRSRVRELVIAERWHQALCAQADLSMTDRYGGCSRVDLMRTWGESKKLLELPFEPWRASRTYVVDWLDHHADEIAPQVVPAELAAITPPPDHPSIRLQFSREELAAWDEEERGFAQS